MTEYELLQSLTPAERRAYVKEREAQQGREALKTIMSAINGSGVSVSGLADAIASEHPTLVGQLAKAVALGVMRRAMRDLDWQPYDKTDQPGYSCIEPRGLDLPVHHVHDGRIDCATVIGAELMARQSFI